MLWAMQRLLFCYASLYLMSLLNFIFPCLSRDHYFVFNAVVLCFLHFFFKESISLKSMKYWWWQRRWNVTAVTVMISWAFFNFTSSFIPPVRLHSPFLLLFKALSPFGIVYKNVLKSWNRKKKHNSIQPLPTMSYGALRKSSHIAISSETDDSFICINTSLDLWPGLFSQTYAHTASCRHHIHIIALFILPSELNWRTRSKNVPYIAYCRALSVQSQQTADILWAQKASAFTLWRHNPLHVDPSRHLQTVPARVQQIFIFIFDKSADYFCDRKIDKMLDCTCQ